MAFFDDTLLPNFSLVRAYLYGGVDALLDHYACAE